MTRSLIFFRYLPILSFVLVFQSCKDSKTKNDSILASKANIDSSTQQQPPKKDCEDYIVEAEAGQEMRDDFVLNFKDERLTRKFWLEACAVNTINDALNGDSLDGVRFYSGFDNKKTTLIMVPTSAVLHPTKTYIHTDRWDIKLSTLCATSEIFMNRSKMESRIQTKPFAELIREQSDPEDQSTAKKNLISSGIWVNKCVFSKLAEVIAANKKQLDGIVLVAAAYSKKYPARDTIGAMDPEHSSTFILLPSDAPGHTPNWTILNGHPIAAFNHSQLCPKICD